MQSATKLAKLELGCGHRPTPGYIHNDINDFDGVDVVSNPWEITFPDGSLDEVIALGNIEHLTYEQVNSTFRNIYRMLKPGGIFLFDVPEIPAWCKYVVDHFEGKSIPFTIEHVFATLYGWQRWPGDEHKSGWYMEKLAATIEKAGFSSVSYGVETFLSRGLERNRMARPADAHIYCTSVK